MKFFDIDIDIFKGTINRPRAIIDTYTMDGNDVVYVQKLRTESIENRIELHKFCETMDEVNTFIDAITEKVGTRGSADFGDAGTFEKLILKDRGDYTYKRIKMCEKNWVVTMPVTVLMDKKEDTSVF